jgi:hypothetical protein
MNQEIFNARLSVETVSLYLLCCALADEGASITLEKLRERWNSTEADLQQSLNELTGKNILRRGAADGSDDADYRLTKHTHWQP